MFSIGITDHLEGPRDRPSAEIYAEAADLVRLADELGASHVWFAEHHAHLHRGHLPTPLLFALRCAANTSRVQLGTAVICLNLHDALDVAEQVAVVDVLTAGRTCVGFGSGSTPEEVVLFSRPEKDEAGRHQSFRESLQTVFAAWAGGDILPKPPADLRGRCWCAVNSIGAARVAEEAGLNVLYSHLRTPEQYIDYTAAYREAGGRGLIAANRPVFAGVDDASALRILWRRFQAEGKIPAQTPEPRAVEELCGHPINFIIGGPKTVAQRLLALHAVAPFDVANVEVRWDGLSHQAVCDSARRLLRDVPPLVREAMSDGP